MQQKSQTIYLDPASAVPQGVELPDISDMPAEISYFFVLPRQNTASHPKAHVLTYNDDPTFQSLLDKYISDSGYAPPGAKQFNFTLANEAKILHSLTTRDLKKLLARDSLDGILLYVEYSSEEIDEQEYIDECCMTDYFTSQKEYGKKKTFCLRFEITLEGCPNTEVLYLDCKPFETGVVLLDRLVEEVGKQFQLKGPVNDGSIRCSYTNAAGKVVKLIESQALARQKVYNESTVTVRLPNPKKEELRRVNAPKYNSWLVIYKENESEPIRVKYDEVASITVGDLYRSRLQLKESERRRDAVYCLKIMDRILKPQEKLNSAELYFKNNDNNKPLNVVAKVVNQKMIFYKAIPALAAEKKAEFKLSEITIPKNQQEHREKCERVVRERAEKAPVEYFKIVQNVEPIVIYTSQLKYLDEATKQELVIYQSLNKFLRETPILSLQESNFQKEWRLRYASTLLKHLHRTKLYQGDTWRGITYDPALSKKDIGTILTFKQFTSTSIHQSIAVNFATKYSTKAPYHLFSFKTKTGRSVIEYSLFGEGEILLQPYTEFELTSVDEAKIEGVPFKIYRMEQRLTSKVLPGIKGNFVIWIDGNTKEGRAVYDRIQLPCETTILEQLTSTSELKQWLKRHEKMFSDKSANLIFLTNMTRKQGNENNQTAGIDAAKLIRQFSKTVPIFFYIGNLQLAKKKLADSKINMENIFVGNQFKDVDGFLRSSLAVGE